MWQELLDGWQSHKGSRNAAHAHLQARFKAALGNDFDLCVYDAQVIGLQCVYTVRTHCKPIT